MTHDCKNLVLGCMDFRLAGHLVGWCTTTLGNKTFDLVALAGSQGAIVNEETRATVLKQIEIAYSLHGVRTVHLVAHQDCGAYGGSFAFSDDWQEEKSKYEQDLREASAIIKENYADIDVKMYIMMLPEDGKVKMLNID